MENGGHLSRRFNISLVPWDLLNSKHILASLVKQINITGHSETHWFIMESSLLCTWPSTNAHCLSGNVSAPASRVHSGGSEEGLARPSALRPSPSKGGKHSS